VTPHPLTTEPVVGIDGCPGGWIAARWAHGSITWSFAPVEGIGDLLPDDGCVGVDMPIGLLDSGLRECDALARRALPGAASRVFTTPPRPVLDLGADAPNAEVQTLSRRLTGQGVSRQALHLAPRILALDSALTARPELRVVEVHPELSFAAQAGGVLDRKATPEGVWQRTETLRSWLPDVDDLLAARPRRVPVVDTLDALAALWSAARWRDGASRTLPDGASTRPFIAI
jgi:predicted RNase H-like nuclease